MDRIKRGDLVSVNWSCDPWIAVNTWGGMWVVTSPESGCEILVARRQLQKFVAPAKK